MPRSDADDFIYRQIDRKEAKVEGRIGKDLKTWAGVFDKPTVMTLHRMLRNGVLSSIDYPVSTGKEADVFHATDGDGLPLALKIYRVSTPTFKRVLQYIEGDPRFRSVPRDHRALVKAWTMKEYRNLERFREAGVDVPVPFRAADNVLLMEYIGSDQQPAPAMKASAPEDAHAAWLKLTDDYLRILRGAHCVHADFSEYNVLMDEGRPRVIDCGQAVLTSHPMAPEFLERDVGNLARYFARRGVDVDEASFQAEATAALENEPDEADAADEEF